MPEVDFTQVSDDEFSLIPEGKYLAQIEKVTEKKTKNGEFDLWAIKSVIQDGDFKGQKIFDNMTFNPTGLGRVKKLYSALGYDTAQSLNCDPCDVEGGYVYITVKHEEYNGQTRAKVEFAGYESVPSDIKDKLTGKQKTESKPTDNEVPADELIGNDEMPF